jgi:hypothetical protein
MQLLHRACCKAHSIELPAHSNLLLCQPIQLVHQRIALPVRDRNLALKKLIVLHPAWPAARLNLVEESQQE